MKIKFNWLNEAPTDIIQITEREVEDIILKNELDKFTEMSFIHTVFLEKLTADYKGPSVHVYSKKGSDELFAEYIEQTVMVRTQKGK